MINKIVSLDIYTGGFVLICNVPVPHSLNSLDLYQTKRLKVVENKKREKKKKSTEQTQRTHDNTVAIII